MERLVFVKSGADFIAVLPPSRVSFSGVWHRVDEQNNSHQALKASVYHFITIDSTYPRRFEIEG